VRLDDPPRWNRNPVTGAEWPDVPSAALEYRGGTVAGGAKPAWELGRLTLLPTLALAARITASARSQSAAMAWLADFTARNPLGRGIHHTSGIEMALRVLTSSWTLALLGERADRARVAGAARAHRPAGAPLSRPPEPRLERQQSPDRRIRGDDDARRRVPGARARHRLLDRGLEGSSASACARSTRTASPPSRRSATCRSCGSCS
jgi:hypothetical protein